MREGEIPNMTDLQILVQTDEPLETDGYVEAGESWARRKIQAVGTLAMDQLVDTIGRLATALGNADLPAGVESVSVSMGLAMTGEFGVSIAGAGVEADVNVEISWKP